MKMGKILDDVVDWFGKLSPIIAIAIFLFAILVVPSWLSETEWKTQDGTPFTKNDLFRVQIATDPFYENVIIDLINLSYYELLSYQIINEDNQVNNDINYWEDFIRNKDAWNKLEWYDTGVYTYEYTLLGIQKIKYERACLYGRWMVYV